MVLDEDIKRLEERLGTLVNALQRLKEENYSLRSQQRDLTRENARLAEKTRLARSRIESIIGRLKTMETGS